MSLTYLILCVEIRTAFIFKALYKLSKIKRNTFSRDIPE